MPEREGVSENVWEGEVEIDQTISCLGEGGRESEESIARRI